MEQQVKTKVQFTDDYNAFTNLENNDSLSTGFGKIHYDLGYLKSEDQRQESEINAIAQAGSKNICPIGTETHSSEIGFGTEYSFQMPEGAYIISFTGTMVAPIQFNVYSESGTRIALVDIHTIQEAEAGIRFVLNDNATKCKFWYNTSDNYTLSNIMIRDANITDNTFQPYSPTNRELYNSLGEKQDTISDLSTIRSGAAAGATALQQSDVTSTYSATGAAPVNGTAVNAAIGTLDVSSVGGSGKYISAISEANGKISATPTTFDTALSSSSTDTNAPTSKAVYDDQQRQDALEAEDRAALVQQIDNGAKNFFDISALKSSGSLAAGSYTNNGVTYTLNSDGTISLSGTATQPSTCSFVLFNSNSPFLAKFAGKELSGGLSNKVYLAIEMATSPFSSLAVSQGEASTIAAPDNTKQYLFYIRVMRGENVDGKVISPMICTAADWAISQKFVPYRPSWQELTTKEQQNENNLLLNTKYGGGRNVGNFAYYGLNHDQSIAVGTITYTESNGVFTFTGAADSSKNYACYLLKKQIIKAGKYVVSGISGGSTSTYWFRIGTGISDTFKMNVTDSGTTLTLDSDTKITLQLVVKSGVSLSNKVFSPMIITAADWANSHDFQQYGESNAQLSSIVQVDIDNMTEFKFAKLDELSSSTHFKYGFLIGGGGVSSPNKVMLWHIFVNTSNSVYFTKIIGDDAMTLTGSISDGVLTITSSATIYGGLRLIWLG